MYRFEGAVCNRSPVYGAKGMVATSQTSATRIGCEILAKGGNAIDAAIAIAAALAVIEPCSTGLGGDCFLLFYNAETKQVEGMNGSGRASRNAQREDRATFDEFHASNVTVPGAVAGWCDALEKWGTMTREQVLNPAIQLAEEGFIVPPITAELWASERDKLLKHPNGSELLDEGLQAPRPGQLFRNKNLASVLRRIVEIGKDAFYKGDVAEAIIDIVQSQEGRLTIKDLQQHYTEFIQPISAEYRDVRVYEMPPNGQGITCLMALNLLETLPTTPHSQIEALRLAFADAKAYVADPLTSNVPIKQLLSTEYANSRRKLISNDKAQIDVEQGKPLGTCDTVSFCVVDRQGNAISMVNSNYCGFGTGLIPKGCGFTLQNRGANFSSVINHPNAMSPGRRPYHTILPGIATKNGELYCTFNVMGGFMQPQGHCQVLTNLIDKDMNSQEALDAPRFCIDGGDSKGLIFIEDGFPKEEIDNLVSKGHCISMVKGYKRAIFGRGQIIKRYPKSGILEAGSDGRSDGMAFGL